MCVGEREREREREREIERKGERERKKKKEKEREGGGMYSLLAKLSRSRHRQSLSGHSPETLEAFSISISQSQFQFLRWSNIRLEKLKFEQEMKMFDLIFFGRRRVGRNFNWLKVELAKVKLDHWPKLLFPFWSQTGLNIKLVSP